MVEIVENNVGRARTVSVEVKAAYLCGLYAGMCSANDRMPEADCFHRELRPHAKTAALIAFGDGAFNPLSVFEMERFYDRVVDNCEKS